MYSLKEDVVKLKRACCVIGRSLQCNRKGHAVKLEGACRAIGRGMQ